MYSEISSFLGIPEQVNKYGLICRIDSLHKSDKNCLSVDLNAASGMLLTSHILIGLIFANSARSDDMAMSVFFSQMDRIVGDDSGEYMSGIMG